MMNEKPTNGYKEDPQEKLPPIDETVSDRPKINKISTEKLNHTSSKDCQERWPNWIMACASILLVLVTVFYTYYAKQQIHLTREGLDATRDALAENTRQFDATLQEIKEQTVAAQIAAAASEESSRATTAVANETKRQVAIAHEQMEIAKQQIADARDALRLDQRAWLGYEHYVIEARENDALEWKKREPRAGDLLRGRLYFQNIGKTPARNVRFMNAPPIWIRAGEISSEPKEEEWSVADGIVVVFPNDDGLSQNTSPLPVPNQIFSAYSNGTRQVFFWARLSYCDTAGRHHWSQVGVAHSFEAGNFEIQSSSVSPDPGEANHPNCQN